jgi:hypothetical protein
MNIFKRIRSWFNKKETVNKLTDGLFDNYDREKDNSCLNPIQMQKNREYLRNNVFSKEEYNKNALSKSKRYDECEGYKNVVKRIAPHESNVITSIKEMIDRSERTVEEKSKFLDCLSTKHFRKLDEKGNCGSIHRVIGEEAKGDTTFYYRIPLGDLRVLIIAGCLPHNILKSLLSGHTIFLYDENGKILRFRNSFIKNHPSEEEESVAILEFSKMVKEYKRKNCTLSNDNIDEILNSHFNHIISKYGLLLDEINNIEKDIGRTIEGEFSKDELEEEKEIVQVLEKNRLIYFNLNEKNL